MKVWVDVRKWDKKIITTCIEAGVDAFIVNKSDIKKTKELGLVTIVSTEDADLIIGKNVFEIEINSKKDEEEIASLASDKIAIVRTKDWSIIPLENLIAQNKKIIYPVSNLEEAKTASGILEKGVYGVLIESGNINVVKEITEMIKNSGVKLDLKEFVIEDVKKVSIGDRVCIDTITNMSIGEGMLIGNYSNAFFLVHSESIENPYVSPRPFRVNAGAVHAYVLLPDGKTKYLDELRTGDEVLIVDSKGNTKITSIGRIKLEKRPMLNITAMVEGKEVSVVLQNAETIRLTGIDGKPISVVNLKKGDKVLGYTEEGGRHFGYKIKETINEK